MFADAITLSFITPRYAIDAIDVTLLLMLLLLMMPLITLLAPLIFSLPCHTCRCCYAAMLLPFR